MILIKDRTLKVKSR